MVLFLKRIKTDVVLLQEAELADWKLRNEKLMGKQCFTASQPGPGGQLTEALSDDLAGFLKLESIKPG